MNKCRKDCFYMIFQWFNLLAGYICKLIEFDRKHLDIHTFDIEIIDGFNQQ